MVDAGGALPDPGDRSLLWLGSFVLMLQFLSHGILWSLLVKRVLAAVALGAVTGVVTWLACGVTISVSVV